MKKWGEALADDGDILIYGCDLAGSQEGRSLIEALSRLTGADVAASEDRTGAAAKGGDWELEFRTGSIEAQIVVSADEQRAWNHILAEPTYVGYGTLASGTGTITPALPAGIQAGDVLLAVFESQGGQAVSFTNQNGGAWNLLANPNINTNDNSTRLTVFWSVYNGTQGNPTTNDPGNHISGFIAAFRGVNTSTPINITSQSTGNSAAVSLATATTTVADTLVVMVGSSDDDADMFGPWANAGLSSVTDRYQASHALGSQGTISMATGIRATAGSYAASTSTLSGSSRWAGMTIALAPGRAPVLDAGTSPVLNAINEDAGPPSGAVGTLVSSLVDFPGGGGLNNVTDADSPALLGIAITAADTTNGSWFYSINNGTNWTAFTPSVANSQLLAADANTRIYFQPNADFNGTLGSAITFRAWDRTSGTNGGTANTTTNGGTTAFSSVTDTASLTVTPVNDAPTATNLSAAETYTEDTALNLTNIVVSDVDSANVTVTLTLSDVAAGALNTATSGAVTSTFVGGVWTAAGALADVNTLLAGLTFTPALNYNANFTIATSVSDGVAAPLSGTKTMTGTPVNDAPTATNLSAAETYTEDTALNLTNIVVSDVDSANVTVTLTLSDVAAGALNTATSGAVTSTFVGGVWTAAGALADVNTLLAGLTFTPALNYNANFTIATSVSDGVAAPLSGTKTMTGTPVNDAPTAVDDAYTVAEDNTLTVSWWDTDWTRRQQITFNNTNVGGFASAETLTNFPVLVVLNSSSIDYAFTQGDGGDLRFFDADGTSLACEIERWDETGNSYVWVKVPQIDIGASDSILMYYGNAAAADGEDPSIVWAGTGYRSVYHLNDAGGVIEDATSTNYDGTPINGASGAQPGQIGLAYGFDGVNDYINLGANRSFIDGATAATFSAWVNADDLSNPNLILSASITSGAPSGTSRMAIELDPGGEIKFIVRSGDGVDTTVFTTTPVTAGAWHYVTGVVNLATDEVTVYVDGTVRALTGAINLPAPVFPNTSSASSTIGSSDDGAAPYFDGRIDEARVATVARTVGWIQAEYRAMLNQAGTQFVSFGSAQIAPALGGVLSNDTDAENDPLSVTLVSGVSNGILTLNPDGTFVYTPNADFFGTDTFTYRANDGAIDSNIATVTITVTPVNDAPTATNLSAAETYTEDTALNLTNIVVSDVDSANVTVTLTLSDVAAGALNTATSGAVTSTFVGGVWTAAGALADVNTLLAGLTFTPALNYNANFTIATSVSDGVAAPLSGTKTMTGTPVNDAPTAVDDAYATAEDGAIADGWLLPTWTQRAQLTFNNSFSFTDGVGSAVTAQTLVDFPVLVALNSGNVDYAQIQNAGQDLRFFDPDGTALAYEIERWDETGDSFVWVRVPQIDATAADHIWMYYGNAAAAAGQNPAAVWSSGYTGVYHLNEAGGGAINDSSASNNDGASIGTTGVTGVIGGGQDFELTQGDWINLGTNRNFVNGAGAATVSAWINTESLAEVAQIFGASVGSPGAATSSRASINLHTGTSAIEGFGRTGDLDGSSSVFTANNQVALDTWQYVTAVIDYATPNGRIDVYVDGIRIATGTPAFTANNVAATNSQFASLGREDDGSATNRFDGMMDEVRLATTNRTAAWNYAEYLSMRTQFVTFGVPSTSVLANDTDEDSARLTASLVAGPSNGTLTLRTDGTFTYTPNADFNGTDTFTYRASDGASLSNVATVTITVNPVGDIANDAVSTNEDTAVVLGVLANDSFESPGRAVTSVSGAANGTVAILDGAIGTVEYTPNANFNGSDSFTYTVTSGGVTETATVSVTIDAVPDLVDDAYTVDEDSGLTNLAVLGNDDTGSGLGTITSVSAGSLGGTIAIAAGNTSINYTPAPGVSGTETFTYTFTDSNGDTDTATVSVTIDAVPDLVDDAYTVDEDSGLTNLAVLGNDDTGSGLGTITSVSAGSLGGTIAIAAGNTSINYTPAPGVSGTETFTYTFTDSNGDTDTATVSVTIDAVPDLVDDAYTVDEDSGLTNLAVLGNDDTGSGLGTITSVSAGSLGGTIAIAAGNTSINYTPAPGVSGTETFTYTFTDSNGDTDTATVSVTIDAVPDLVDDAYTVDEDSGLTNLAVLGNDDTGSGLGTITSVSAGSLGGTIAIAAGNTSINYTPAPGVSGTETFTYTFTDSNGDTDTATVSVTIDAVPDLVDDAYTVDEDSGLTNLAVLGNDDTGSGLGTITSVSAGSLGGTIAIAAGNTSINYTPAPGVSGTETFTYTFTDSNGDTDTATVSVTIDAVPDLVDDAYTVDEDSGLTNLAVLGNDDTGSGLGTITSVSAGSLGGTIAIAAGNTSINYTPAPGVSGTETFTYTFTDSNGDTDTATVSVTIDAVPDLVDDAYTVDEDSGLTNLAVLGNDDTGSGLGTITSVSAGSLGGTIAIAAGNTSINYTPAPGVSGTETFTYTFTDSNGDTDTATVSVTIDAVPDLVDDAYTVDEDSGLTNLAVLGNDDTGSGLGTITSVSAGSLGGTIAIAAGNTSINYTPAPGVSGTETFTYTFTDSNGDTDTATVSVTIDAVPDLVDDAYTVDEDSGLTNLAVLGNDDTGSGLGTITSVSAGSLGGTIAIAAGNTSINYTPAPGVSGTETFTYTFTDSNGDTDTATVSVTIDAVPDLVDDAYTVDEDSGLTNLAVLGNDDTGSGLGTITSVSAGSLGGTIAIAAGNTSINYTPAPGVSGTETFTYTFTDSNGDTDTATVSVTIDAVPDLVDDAYTVDEDSGLTNLAVLGNDDTGSGLGTITSVSAGSLGGTIAIAAGNTSINYTPAPGVSGTETFTYTFTDSNGDTDTATVSVTIDAVPDLVDDAYTVDEDSGLTNLAVLGNDDTGSGLGTITSVSAGSLGGTIAIAAGNTSINYTPAPGVSGTETFTYTFTDSNGDTDTATVSVTIDAVPDLVDDAYTVDEDSGLTNLAVLGNDDTGSGLGTITSVSAGSLGGTIAIAAGNTSINYTPAPGVSGTETFTYTFTDSNGDTDTATVSVTIDAVPDLVDDAYTVDEDSGLTNLAVLGNDDTGSGLGTITSVSAGSLGGTIAIAAGNTSINYTPAPGVSGTETFTYTFTDSNGDTDTATVSVTIDAVPDLVDDAYTVDEDSGLTNLAVLGNDDTGSGLGTITSVSAGSLGGTIAIAAGNTSINYTPAPGVSGTETFTYTFTDSNGDTDTATVSVTIDAVPDLVDDAYTVDEDSGLTNLAVLGNDDTGSGLGTITSVSAGSLGGTIAIAAGNTSINYTPAPGVSGTETFTYTFTDSNGDTDTATVSVTIDAVPDLVDDAYTVDEDSGLTNLAVLGNDDTGSGLGTITSVSAGSLGGTIAIAAGNTSINYTPAPGVSGTETFTYTFTDSNGDTDTATVSVTIDAVPDLVDDAYTVDEDSGLTNLAVLGNDDTGSGLGTITSVSAGSLGGTIAIAAGNTSINYTPAPGVSGTETFTYTFTDSNGDTDTATVSVTIDAVPDLVDDAYTVDEDSGLTNLAVLGNDDTGSGLGTITSVSAGSLGGTIAIAAGNTSINYTPAPGVSGTETFTYTFTDSNGDTDTATVSVTIDAVPDLVDDAYTVDEDSGLTNLAVLGNDDTGSGLGTITSVSAGSLGGTIAIAAGNTSINYTPAPGVSGTETFTYTFTDSNGDTDTATVSVTIDAVPDLVDDAYTVDEDSGLTNLAVLGNDDTGSGLGTITSVSAGSLGGTIAIAAGNTSIPRPRLRQLHPGARGERHRDLHLHLHRQQRRHRHGHGHGDRHRGERHPLAPEQRLDDRQRRHTLGHAH